jgi:P pilus assembly chaperone PapD
VYVPVFCSHFMGMTWLSEKYKSLQNCLMMKINFQKHALQPKLKTLLTVHNPLSCYLLIVRITITLNWNLIQLLPLAKYVAPFMQVHTSKENESMWHNDQHIRPAHS